MEFCCLFFLIRLKSSRGMGSESFVTLRLDSIEELRLSLDWLRYALLFFFSKRRFIRRNGYQNRSFWPGRGFLKC